MAEVSFQKPLENQKVWNSRWFWTQALIFQADCIRKHDVSGPKKISQVKMCHLVTGLLKNIVARSVENASHDGLCFDVSTTVFSGHNPSGMMTGYVVLALANQTLHYSCFPDMMAQP